MRVVNEASFPVDLEGWRSPCPCLDVEDPPERLEPKSEGRAVLILDAAGYRGNFSKNMLVVVSAEGFERAETFVRIAFAVREDGEPELPPVPASLSESSSGGWEFVEYDPVLGVEAAREADAWIFGGKNCSACARMKSELLPKLIGSLPAKIVTADLERKESLLLLLSLEERIGLDGRDTKTPVLYWRNKLFYGLKAVEEMAGNPSLRPTEVTSTIRIDPLDQPAESGAGVQELARRRTGDLTAGVVALAGLVDGINPCAIATLVFLLSALTVARVSGARLLAAGGAYCLASFATYFLIGLGLLQFIRSLEGLAGVRTAFNWGMAAALVVLAVLSLRDAFRLWKTGKGSELSLKLPDGIRDRIHRLIRGSRSGGPLRRRGLALVLTCFGLGAVVTLLEAVCTGQVYLPALTLMAESEPSSMRWLGLLALYNVLFVLPLAVAMGCMAVFRIGTPTLLRMGRIGAVAGKLAVGALFALLAALLLWI